MHFLRPGEKLVKDPGNTGVLSMVGDWRCRWTWEGSSNSKMKLHSQASNKTSSSDEKSWSKYLKSSWQCLGKREWKRDVSANVENTSIKFLRTSWGSPGMSQLRLAAGVFQGNHFERHYEYKDHVGSSWLLKSVSRWKLHPCDCI